MSTINNLRKRALALFMALVMTLSLVQVTAFAAEDTAQEDANIIVTDVTNQDPAQPAEPVVSTEAPAAEPQEPVASAAAPVQPAEPAVVEETPDYELQAAIGEVAEGLQSLGDRFGAFQEEFFGNLTGDEEDPMAYFTASAGAAFGMEFNALLAKFKAIPAAVTESEYAGTYAELAYALQMMAAHMGGDLNGGIDPMIAAGTHTIRIHYQYGSSQRSCGSETCTYSNPLYGGDGWGYTIPSHTKYQSSFPSGYVFDHVEYAWNGNNHGYVTEGQRINIYGTGMAVYFVLKADSSGGGSGGAGTTNPPGSSSGTVGSGSHTFYAQVVYVNKAKTSFTYGNRYSVQSSAKYDYGYTLSRSEFWPERLGVSAPSGYSLVAWQKGDSAGSNFELGGTWWTATRSGSTTDLYSTTQHQTTVIFTDVQDTVYLIYQGEPPKVTYTLKFNGNGSTVNGQQTYTVTSPETTDSSYGFAYVQPDTRTEYQFLGWATTSGAGSPNVSFPYTVDSSNNGKTLYAVWNRINQVTLTYHGNGHTGGSVPTAQTVNPGEGFVVRDAGDMTRSGYDFLGWNADPRATTADWNAGDTMSIVSDDNLYAVWKAEQVTLTYNANGGSNAPTAVTVPKGQDITIKGKQSMTHPDGLEFLGWSTDPKATTADSDWSKYGDVVPLNASLTLYAVWKTTIKVPVDVKVQFVGLDAEDFTAPHIHGGAYFTGVATNPQGTTGGYYQINGHKDGTETDGTPYILYDKDNSYPEWTVEKGREYNVHYNLNANSLKIDGYTYVSANGVSDAKSVDFTFKADNTDKQTLVITLVYTKNTAKPVQKGTWKLDITKEISNYNNKGKAITVSDLPEDFAVNVTVEYHNGTQRVTETKTLTAATRTNTAADSLVWKEVFNLPDWRYDFTGTDKTADDFAEYNTIVKISESNCNIAGYSCTMSSTNTNPVENGIKTQVVKVQQSGTTSNQTSCGIRNRYQMYDKWVQMSKTANKSTVEAGGTVNYTVTFYNYTGQPQTVNFADNLPQGMTLAGDVTVSGDTTAATHDSLTFDFVINAAPKKTAGVTGDPRTMVTVTYTASVAGSVIAGKTLTNKAAATVNKASYKAEAPVTVVPANPALTGITKALTGVKVNNEDKGTTIPTLTVGDEVELTYTITVTGDAGAKYTVTDPGATPETTRGVLGSSKSAEITVTKTVTVAADTTKISNTAYVKPTDNTTDPIDPTKPGNDKTPDDEKGYPSDPVNKDVTVVPAKPVLTITKTVDKTSVKLGGELEYTITVTNTGTVNATKVVVKDTLPEGLSYVQGSGNPIPSNYGNELTWGERRGTEITVAANGGTWTATFRAKANQCGTWTNTASVECGEVETPARPKTPPKTVVFDLGITKSYDENIVVDTDEGTATVKYTITVKNTSGFDLYGLDIIDELAKPNFKGSSAVELTLEPLSLTSDDPNVTVGSKGASFKPSVTQATTHVWEGALGRNTVFKNGSTVTLTYNIVITNKGAEQLAAYLSNTAWGGCWVAQEQTPAPAMMFALLSDDGNGGKYDAETGKVSTNINVGALILIPPKGEVSVKWVVPGEDDPFHTDSVPKDEIGGTADKPTVPNDYYPENNPDETGHWSDPVKNPDGTITITWVTDTAGTHTITVNVTNGTSDATSPVTVTDGDSKTITFTPGTGMALDTVTVDGQPATLTDGKYTFSDVKTDHTITVVYAEDKLVDPDNDKNGDEPGDGIPDKYQREVTYKVVNGYWNEGNNDDPKKVTVTLKDSSGNPSLDGTATLTAPAVGSKPKDTYKAGYAAANWDTDPATVTLTKDSAKLEYTYTYVPEGTYTVTFDSVGGTPIPPQNVTEGGKAAEPTDPTKQNAVFVGWVKEGETEPYDFDTVLTGDIKLVAQWETDEMIDPTVPVGDRPATGGDGIPDKYQVRVQYVTANPAQGTVTGSVTKVFTLGTAPGYATTGTITPGTVGVVTTGINGYVLSGWDFSPYVGRTVNGGQTYTYWAYWTVPQITIPTTPTPGTGGTTTIPNTPTPLDPGEAIGDEEVPLAGAVGLNDTDHFAYVIGYDDDTVRPLNNISRAEVATIFFRLMTDDYRNANWATANDFSDVAAGDWYNNAISTCANAGALKGRGDGTRFDPNANITRAEFAAIAARFLDQEEYTDDGTGDFADTANHWAAKEIRLAAKAGWVTGSGNKFRPDDYITRAEVMTIVNRMLDRTPDKDHMLPEMKKWTDNPEDAWYYEAVQEATNEHDYERDEANVESWTLIKEVRDWAALELGWAANNGVSDAR